LGWVRNRPDGAVEVVAEGPRAALEQLLSFLQQGPQAANVSQVESAWRPASEAFSEFEVRW
jgi:acylphosphatase